MDEKTSSMEDEHVEGLLMREIEVVVVVDNGDFDGKIEW